MNSHVFNIGDVKEVSLQMFKTITERHISDGMVAEAIIANSVMSIEYNAAMNDHVFYLKTMIAGCDRKVARYTEYCSWWDMFKDTKFPKWLKKRFPPNVNKFVVNVREIVPSLIIPGHKTHMSVYVIKER